MPCYFQFPSSAPSKVVYPPTSELNVTVSVADASGLVSNTAFPASQSDTFFNLGSNELYYFCGSQPRHHSSQHT